MAPIPQSDTRWVKKPGKAGYVEQISTGKRVTGKVALSTTIGAGGKTIANKRGISDYAKGRNVTKVAKYADKPSRNGAGQTTKPQARPVPQTRTVPRAGETKVTPLKSPNATDLQGSQRVGTGLRGTPSARGKLGTGSGSTTRVGVAPKPKRPMTAAERNKATGGVNAYGMMGGSEGTVRTQRNKSKTGVLTPEFSRPRSASNQAALQAKADAAAKSRRSTEERLRTGANKILADRRTREAAARKAAEEKKQSSGPKIGETKKVSAGVGYVQVQKYTSKGWVNVGPKRRSK